MKEYVERAARAGGQDARGPSRDRSLRRFLSISSPTCYNSPFRNHILIQSGISSVLSQRLSNPVTKRVIALFFILVLAFSVRALTANFLRAHLDEPWLVSQRHLCALRS